MIINIYIYVYLKVSWDIDTLCICKFLNILFFVQEALISYDMKQSTSREFITVIKKKKKKKEFIFNAAPTRFLYRHLDKLTAFYRSNVSFERNF